MSTPKLRLTVKQIRGLQTKHGISNLLQPVEEDGKKVANVDFLVEYYYEGSRSWEAPPTLDDVEGMFHLELFEAFGDSMKPEGLVGKG